jgi:probable phosphoglycerate mutase
MGQCRRGARSRADADGVVALDEWGAWSESRQKAVVVVTHDAVVRPLLARIAPSLPAVSVPTGSYQVLRYDTGIWSVELTDQQAPLLE